MVTSYVCSRKIGGGRVVRRCWVNFQCRGVLLTWISVGQGPIVLAVGAGGGCLDIFYAPPQKVAGYYVILSELLSVCPSVCPSVRPSLRPPVRPSAVEHSCPVHHFDTVRDNFTKLGTNVKHDQTTCRDYQPSLHLHFLRNYSPLKFSV